MPRQATLDAPGTLHHVIIRGIEGAEWRVLSAWARGKIADIAPSVQQVMRWIGKLGGWRARMKQDNPGTTCMWRGLTRLPSMVQSYLLALQVHGIRDGPCPAPSLKRGVPPGLCREILTSIGKPK